jgi:hypothetical protein
MYPPVPITSRKPVEDVDVQTSAWTTLRIPKMGLLGRACAHGQAVHTAAMPCEQVRVRVCGWGGGGPTR